MSLNQQFRKVVSSPLATLSVEELKPIALGVWHEDYTPELNDMNLVELQKAGYLIDRLMRYNCVSVDRKIELLGLVKDIKQNLPQETQAVSSLRNVDPVAKKWNLKEDVSRLISSLLEYQTRHYSHEKALV
jgi:hypothetical protein